MPGSINHCVYDWLFWLLQSIINDVNMLTSEGEWTVEERLALESQLVLATAKPLCLDPSPAVSLVQQRLHHRRHALNTPGISNYGHFLIKCPKHWYHHLQSSGSIFVTNCFSPVPPLWFILLCNSQFYELISPSLLVFNIHYQPLNYFNYVPLLAEEVSQERGTANTSKPMSTFWTNHQYRQS